MVANFIDEKMAEFSIQEIIVVSIGHFCTFFFVNFLIRNLDSQNKSVFFDSF